MRFPLPGSCLAIVLSAVSPLADRYLHFHPVGFANPAWFFSIWLVVMDLHALLHEGAHAAAGLALGLPVISVTAAGVRVYRDAVGKPWRLGVREPHISPLGGITYIEHEPGTTARLILSVAAGPALSLTLFLIAFGFTLSLSGRLFLAPARTVAVICAIHFGWNALYNLIPVPKRLRQDALAARATDGTVLADLFSLKRFLTIHPQAEALREWALSGKRLRDCPISAAEALACVPEDLGSRSEFFVVALIRCLDAGAYREARLLMDRGFDQLDTLPRWPRNDLLVQGACYFALVEKDLDRAKELVETAKEYEVGPKYLRIAETAVAFAEGKSDEATKMLDGWLEDAKVARWPHLILAGNEWSLDLMAPGRADALKKTAPFQPSGEMPVAG